MPGANPRCNRHTMRTTVCRTFTIRHLSLLIVAYYPPMTGGVKAADRCGARDRAGQVASSRARSSAAGRSGRMASSPMAAARGERRSCAAG